MTTPTFDPGFTTDAMAAVFSPAARVRAMCRFESALAAAHVAHGLIDEATGDRIAEACATDVDDPDGVLAEGWEAGTPVLPLLERLRAELPDADRDALHHGATTQDVVDTATMLQARHALELLHDGLVELGGHLAGVADEHRDTPASAWTFLQPAVPVTLGLRAATWLSPLVDHVREAREHRHDLPLQLGGPTGTLPDLGDAAPRVVDDVAHRLGLAVPRLPWHTDRTPVAVLAGLLGRIARTMATIGQDLALLAHHGMVTMRAGGSSSMPGKRNPVDAVRAVAAADACAGMVAIVTGGRPHELERAVGGWHAEWLAVPLAFQTCAAAVEAVGRAVESAQWHPEPDVEDGPTPASAASVARVLEDWRDEAAR